MPENIARALYDKYARLHFARQMFLWELRSIINFEMFEIICTKKKDFMFVSDIFGVFLRDFRGCSFGIRLSHILVTFSKN